MASHSREELLAEKAVESGELRGTAFWCSSAGTVRRDAYRRSVAAISFATCRARTKSPGPNEIAATRA